MPIQIAGKTHKTFKAAARAVAKKKGISKERASAYVAHVERLRGNLPGKINKKLKKKRKRG